MEKLILIAIGMFATGFIDAIAGGGGIISLPILMMTGLPIKSAIATNKIGGIAGNATTTYNYYKKGHIDTYMLKKFALLAFLGALAGARLLTYIPSEVLEKYIPYVLMGLVGYTLMSKSIGIENTFRGHDKKNTIIGGLVVFMVGVYNGFFGPATGSFLTIGLISVYGFDFLKGTATSKPLNLIMSLTSGILLILMGGASIKIGIICAVFRSLGGKVGSNLAVNIGAKVIKPIFIACSTLAIIKMIMI